MVDIKLDFINRKHPEYDKYAPEWTFFKNTYEGGRAWFADNIDKYFKEGTDEFKERVERAYRFNHTREVVDLVNKYIFKADIARKDDAPEFIKRFWESTTLQKRDIDHFMNMASAQASIFGRVWIVVDSSLTNEVVSVAEAKRSKGRVYAYTVTPLDVLDLSLNDDGELNWIKIREVTRDDSDPFEYTGEAIEKVRIWTRNEWYLYSADSSDGTVAQKWSLEDSGTHGLGIVPVTYLDHSETENTFTSTALIADIAYLDRKAANYLSNLDAIIQDQSFSQLVIPAEAVAFADDTDGTGIGQKMLEFGTKRIFLYHGEGTNKPDYISPDPSQPEMILNVVNKIIGEIYHSVGMAGERTKQDNAVGIDNSSGVAKAYDFERMNAMLANKAKSLQYCENRIVKIVQAWNNIKTDEDFVEQFVSYSKDFDVRNLANEFDIATQLGIMNAPKSVRREQMKGLVDKLWPQLSKKLRAQIEKDIENEWFQEQEKLQQQQVQAKASAAKPSSSKTSSNSKTGSQGQNNKPADKSK